MGTTIVQTEVLRLPANKIVVVSFSFYVATDQMPAQTNCNATFTTAYTLPNVPTTACVDTSISWSFNAVDSGANYTLILIDFQQGLAASKVWDKADFPTIDAGSTVYQQYIGTPSFVVV